MKPKNVGSPEHLSQSPQMSPQLASAYAPPGTKRTHPGGGSAPARAGCHVPRCQKLDAQEAQPSRLQRQPGSRDRNWAGQGQASVRGAVPVTWNSSGLLDTKHLLSPGEPWSQRDRRRSSPRATQDKQTDASAGHRTPLTRHSAVRF